MSFRLRMASILATRSVLERQLDRVAEMTTGMLDEMVDHYMPEALEALQAEDRPLEGALEKRRLVMADAHRRRVQVLVTALGETAAIERGRRRMGPVGERLGAEARQRFGVDDSMEDLVAAAELVYRVLGIEFDAEEHDDGSVTLHIDRCGLSESYEPVTCRLMSATDEGMIRGLNPSIRMEFSQRMTEGGSKCMAHLDARGGDDL